MRLGLVHPAIRQRPFSADIVMLGWTAAEEHLLHTEREDEMPESVYKVIELIGTSNESWKRPPPTRSSKPQNLSENSASQRSSNSTCNWTPREK